MTTDALFSQFQDPGAAWRGKPFWAWNGRLDKAELLRQVHVMKEMGLGGFFMHSRVGLATEYLGDDWFECINACADEAERLGMEAWLYDEDRWPSGSAGGLVTENPEFRMRFLRCTVHPAPLPSSDGGELARFACALADDGLSYTSLRRLAGGESAGAGETTLVFTVEEMASSNFYNGYTYLDTMSRAATDAFLQSTHEKYVERCGDRLGKSIKGIFTDEPHRGSLMTSFGQGLGSSEWIVPWTPKMPEHWQEAYGDDLLAHLPEIFLFPNGQSVHPTKWRYVELCLSLFIENFCKPMDAWCREHNLILTGHFLHEDNLTSQVAMNGSMLRCYAHMEYPGMDLLTEGNKAFWVAKQLQSVGRQLGKPWLMSELYGCTGWQMGLEGHKNVGDWQALFGVNLRCHHLSWYTMEGEAKRDYPASILHQSAWWKDYAAVETYFARLGFLLSQGEPVCDVLAIHPVESVWAQIHPGWCNGLSPKADSIKKLETQFAELFHWLQGAQIDFDYGDEGILAEYASIDGADFVVGQMRYKTIVIGGCTTIRSTTLKLLEAFAAAGGKVIWVGEKPQFVDAKRAPSSLSFGEQATAVNNLANGILPESLTAESEKSFRSDFLSWGNSDAPGKVFQQVRQLGRDRLIVALNTDRDTPIKETLACHGQAWEVSLLDCLTGEQKTEPGMHVVGRGFGPPITRITTTFLPGELKVFYLRDPEQDIFIDEPGPADTENATGTELPGPFAYSLDESNALVLDTAMWQLDDGKVNPTTEILKIDQAVRRHFGLEVRGGEMVQPWYAEKFHGEPPVLGKLTLRFTFEVEALPNAPLTLAMERPERFVVTVNSSDALTPGYPLGAGARPSLGKGLSDNPLLQGACDCPGEGAGGEVSWVDACFKLLQVPTEALRVGENVVTLTTEFRRDSDLEAIYLLGSFGVRLEGPRRTIVSLPGTLAVGDICSQGLPFYTGCVTYHLPEMEGELELPKIGGACVRVNDQTIPWPPYRATMTGGGCAVTVVLTRRNLFGPLHLIPKQQAAYGPGHWVTAGAHWSDDYQLYPSGLLAAPVIFS